MPAKIGWMEWLFNRLATEMNVIAGAPISFAAAVAAGLGLGYLVIWKILNWRYQGIIDELSHKGGGRDSHNRSEITDAIAGFITQGRELQKRCRETSEQEVIPDANEWIREVSMFLKGNLGKSYEIRFSDYSGLTQYSGRKTLTERDIEFRIMRLTQFMERL